jgi:hypothetical protein
VPFFSSFFWFRIVSVCPGFFDKLGRVDVEGLAEKVPERVRRVGNVFVGFHDYMVVFGFYGERVADLNS